MSRQETLSFITARRSRASSAILNWPRRASSYPPNPEFICMQRKRYYIQEITGNRSIHGYQGWLRWDTSSVFHRLPQTIGITSKKSANDAKRTPSWHPLPEKCQNPSPVRERRPRQRGENWSLKRKATPEARPSKPRQQKGARNKVLTLLASRGKLLRSTPVNKQIVSTIGTRWVHCTTRTHQGYHRFALPQPNFFARRCFVKARSGSIRPDHSSPTSQQAGRSVHELLSSTKRARASQRRRDPRSSDKQEGY